MGAILTLSIVLWLASSFVEYKIVRSSPHLKKLFVGVPGMMISVAISLAIGLLLAPAAGVAVQLAAILGLATNEFTFKLYSGLEFANTKRHNASAKVSAFKSEHPGVFAEAVGTIKLGFKTIVGIFLAIVYIIGLPARIFKAVNAQVTSVRSALTR